MNHKKLFAVKKDAWTPEIGGYESYNEAEKAFMSEFYYSPNAHYCNELKKIAIQAKIDPEDITAVKRLFASFAIRQYNPDLTN